MTALATKPETNGTIAKSEPTLKQWISGDQFKQAVAMALPKHITADRFVRVALNALLRNPELTECDMSSVLDCFMRLSQYGLEADGRQAHLIPFKKNYKVGTEWKSKKICTLIVDYKGLAELVMRSGLVSYLHADVVRRGDLFVYSKGKVVEHVPWFLRVDPTRPEKPGEIFAAYALVNMKDGTEKAEVLSLADIHAIRDESQGWVAFQKGYSKSCPWDPKTPVSEAEMMKKTAFRRLSKWLPLSPEIRDTLDVKDDDHEALVVREAPGLPAGESRSDQLAAMLGAQGSPNEITSTIEVDAEHGESNEQETDTKSETQGETPDAGESNQDDVEWVTEQVQACSSVGDLLAFEQQHKSRFRGEKSNWFAGLIKGRKAQLSAK